MCHAWIASRVVAAWMDGSSSEQKGLEAYIYIAHITKKCSGSNMEAAGIAGLVASGYTFL